MVRRIAVLLTLACLASACATRSGTAAARPLASTAAPAGSGKPDPATKPGVKGNGDSALICQMERPTGSNIPEKVCRPASEVEWERMQTQDLLRAPRSSTGTR